MRLGALSFWPQNYTLPPLEDTGNLKAIADPDAYERWVLEAVRRSNEDAALLDLEEEDKIKVHCIDAVRDCDKKGWSYMERTFNMIGVGYGCIPRGVFRGSVLTYHGRLTHLVVARYSSMWKKLCSTGAG